MVEVDIFEKYATFMAASADCTADEAARLFMKNVVKYWGHPRAPSISHSFMKRRGKPHRMNDTGKGDRKIAIESPSVLYHKTYRRRLKI